MNTPARPSPLRGALIALGGLVVAWIVLRIMPDFAQPAVSGALAGGFGVLAALQFWPGMPMSRLHYLVGFVFVYGIVVGIVGRL